MAYRNQNYMTNRLIKETVDKNQVGYVDPDQQKEEEFVPVLYYFKSYADDQGETFWAAGTVETTNVVENGYTKVKVITNDIESFVNQEFYISSNANANGTTLYPLYSDAGTTAANIYVKISTEEFAEETPQPSQEQEEEFVPVLYYFKSYADDQGETFWASGTVETTNVVENGYTKVTVITNDIESFVNQEFYISSSANADGTTLYPLYSDAGITAADIYVKISTEEFAE